MNESKIAMYTKVSSQIFKYKQTTTYFEYYCLVKAFGNVLEQVNAKSI